MLHRGQSLISAVVIILSFAAPAGRPPQWLGLTRLRQRQQPFPLITEQFVVRKHP